MLISNKASFLCLGLDPDIEKIPAHLKYNKNPIDSFVQEVISATKDLVIAYKANLAFYECEGQNGLDTLKNLCTIIPKDVLLILDGKRADIKNTATKYANAYFDQLGADAVTLNPYMGFDSIEPFINNPEKGAFILALTSNQSALDFQYLQIGTEPLHQYVAKKVERWNTKNNCGLVVGATDIESMQILRGTASNLPFLIPGVGAQGGMLKDVIKYGRDTSGTGMLINVGRDILYTSDGKDFAEKVRQKTQQYEKDMSNLIRTSWEYI